MDWVWIITFLVGNPYKPLFATVTGKGPHPIYRTLREITPIHPVANRILLPPKELGETNKQ